MKRLLCLSVALFLSSSAAAWAGINREPGSVMVAVDGTTARLDRRIDGPTTQLVFKVGRSTVPLEAQGRALDLLLTRMITQAPLPDTMPVLFGATKDTFTRMLQGRLQQKGANWNTHTGKPLAGSYYPVVRGELAALIQNSPIAAAFRRHGYGLRLANIAHVEQDPPSFPHPGVKVPTIIDVMELVATRGGSASISSSAATPMAIARWAMSTCGTAIPFMMRSPVSAGPIATFSLSPTASRFGCQTARQC